MKILCPCPELFSSKALDLLKSINHFKCNFTKLSQKKFEKIFFKYDIILTRFNHKIKFKNTKIKYILSPTTGLDHIDKRYFSSETKVISLFGDNLFLKKINATSEFTIFLILKVLRSKGNKFELNHEINNKSIGIIGYGRIGKKVSKILKSMGAKIFYYDKKFHSMSINKIFEICDLISIHIPLSDNLKFINSSHFKLMKKNSILINTSRGDVVNEKQLFSFTQSQKFIYATDVVGKFLELKYKNNKKLKNIIYSKHVAGLTRESVEMTDLRVIRKFLRSINYE
jgi:D-3-phosphoglycerate dehydrogenase